MNINLAKKFLLSLFFFLQETTCLFQWFPIPEAGGRGSSWPPPRGHRSHPPPPWCPTPRTTKSYRTSQVGKSIIDQLELSIKRMSLRNC